MEIIVIILLAVVIGAIAWMAIQNKKLSESLTKNEDKESIFNQRVDNLTQGISQNLNVMTKNVLEMTRQMNQSLNENTKRVDDRLKQNIEEWQRSHRTIGERLDNAAKSYTAVTNKLTQLEEANKKIYDVGKDIASLQEILRAPKLRGGLGELFLEDLLAQVLPKEHYALQYTFKNGSKIDAVVKLRENQLVPVDAKFPLEDFKKMIEAHDETQRKAGRKLFVSDVKKHIDDIAGKYILPDEGTLDFALMYIPAENVYYEIVIKNSEELNIMDYAMKKKIIPVSPNSFYSYLQTILMGLKGLKIEEQAKEIWKYLGRLKADFEKFNENYTLLGKHLNNARNSYDNSGKCLDRFSTKLMDAEKGEEGVPLLEGENNIKLI